MCIFCTYNQEDVVVKRTVKLTIVLVFTKYLIEGTHPMVPEMIYDFM